MLGLKRPHREANCLYIISDMGVLNYISGEIVEVVCKIFADMCENA